MRKVVRILLASFVMSRAAGGQSNPQQVASQAFNARDWEKAAAAYAAALKTDSTIAVLHLRYGSSLAALGRYDDARRAIASAAAKGAFPGMTAFWMGVIDAGSGRMDSAFAQLKRATDSGLGLIPPFSDSLPALGKLKNDARYAAFLTGLDRNARPCMHDDKHKEFDFWLGSWDVRPRGQPANPPGRNEITKIHNGCVVHESWTAPGSGGQSFNIYDRSRSKWFQIWVDNSGGLHEYSGVYRDNAMRYEGTTPAIPPATGRVQTRLTFFRIAPDTLRQLSESPGPDGSWRVNYDLIYTRRK